ncbi:MAG TPA: VOC family protein [Acidobacteriaceae bacterium]
MTVPGGGGVTLREQRPGDEGATPGRGQSVTVRVDDAEAHCRRAREHGARITQEPVTHPYGERQYSAEDIAGYAWTFSQTVADVDPAEWGGEAVEL